LSGDESCPGDQEQPLEAFKNGSNDAGGGGNDAARGHRKKRARNPMQRDLNAAGEKGENGRSAANHKGDTNALNKKKT